MPCHIIQQSRKAKEQLIVKTYYSHLLLWLNHVVIVVNLCCVEGLMEDRSISNKHSR